MAGTWLALDWTGQVDPRTICPLVGRPHLCQPLPVVPASANIIMDFPPADPESPNTPANGGTTMTHIATSACTG